MVLHEIFIAQVGLFFFGNAVFLQLIKLLVGVFAGSNVLHRDTKVKSQRKFKEEGDMEENPQPDACNCTKLLWVFLFVYV